MQHSHYESKLSEYVLGDLKGEELNEIRLHIDSCKECASSLAALNKVMNIYEKAPFEMPSDAYFASLVPRIREKLEERENIFSRFNIFFSVRWAGAVAAVLVLAISTSLLFNTQNDAHDELSQGEDIYYSGTLQSGSLTIAALSETFESEDWDNLAEIIEEEIGEYSKIFDYDSEEYYSIDLLGNEEWEEFYEKFNNQKIL